MTTPTNIPTVAERELELEHIAVARCIVKTGFFPNQRAVEKEVTLLMNESMRDDKAIPRYTREVATTWLRARGLTVPKAEPDRPK
ncbi:MAG TPA: hypothetical protein PKC67_09945 [Kiritimatiellia bacterium]|nr:hypothetical protein [Kiritimatiellia bacterium]HMP34661.1 hypothetical protein [Kiritimatiellia bacterium]